MAEQATYFGSRARYRAFTAVKYLVYILLSFNVWLFLQEELQALEHTFVDGISPGQLVQVFSATIDTAAWVILLLLFELEKFDGSKKKMSFNGSTFLVGSGPAGEERIPFARIKTITIYCP